MHAVVLCSGCTNIDLNKIAEKISDAEVLRVESCEDEFELNFEHVVFGCPALFHLSDYGMGEIVDLRIIEECFEEPVEVASAWINSSLIFNLPEVEAVETGYNVIYYGNNLDLISELSNNTNLTVITPDSKITKKLYPFRIRVIEAEDKIEVKGKIGNFEVVVDGFDVAMRKTSKFTLKAGQLILPKDFAEEREGLYTYGDEYRAALKVLSNLGGYTRIKAIKIDHQSCGTSKSGFSGCSICFSCPQNSISRAYEKISISDSCNGCGFCAAVCPLSAIEYTVMPSELLIKKIDAVVEEDKTIAFICKHALEELYEIKHKKLPAILPVVVPCINCISDVHYLYSALKGANVVVIPCNARHNFKAFELAKKTLEAFGFNCIKISKFSDLEQIKAENPGKIIEKMDGRNKREQWLHIVKHLMKHPLKNSRVKTDWFGMIEVDGRCTLCMTCTSFCPSNAIRNENALKFNHALCIACNLCKACPENAIKLKKILDFEQIGEREIYRDELLRCPSCGKQHISKAMYEKLSEIGKHSILFCSDCRPKIILETIYDEMMNERKKGEDYG